MSTFIILKHNLEFYSGTSENLKKKKNNKNNNILILKESIYSLIIMIN